VSRSPHKVYRGVLTHENMFCKCLVHGRLATRSSALSLSYASAFTNVPLTFPFPGPRSRLRKQLHLLPSSPSHRMPCPQRRRGPLRRRLHRILLHLSRGRIWRLRSSKGVRGERERTVRLFHPTVTIPGGTNTDIGIYADAGQADCGAGCMLAANTCCPDQPSYCPASEQC
jgi:hypothetical protein